MRMVVLRTVVWTVVVGQLAIFAAAGLPASEGERSGSSNAAKQAATAGDQIRREIDPMHVYASRPPICQLQRPANVHYTAAGSRQLTERVAAAIRKALAD